jgi:hypothetical protein
MTTLDLTIKHINRKRHTDLNPWMTRLQINLLARQLIPRLQFKNWNFYPCNEELRYFRLLSYFEIYITQLPEPHFFVHLNGS